VTIVRDASFFRGIRARSGLHLALGGLGIVVAFLFAAVGVSMRDDADSFATVVFCAPAGGIVACLVIVAALHARLGLTKLVVTFTPDGIVEEFHDRKTSHDWSWLTRFRDDDARLVVELGEGGAKHVFILVKTGATLAVARRLLALLAEHTSSEVARFGRGSTQASSVSRPRARRDLN
jgi:hypothetical protein